MSFLTPVLLALVPTVPAPPVVLPAPQVPARRAPDDRFHAEFVPAEARYIGFLDVARLRASPLGALWKGPMAAESREEVLGEIGFDPIEECSSVLAYNTEREGERAVIVLVMSDVLDTLVAAMEEQGRASFVEYEGHELLKVEDSFAAIDPLGASRRVVFADDPDLVLQGLALLRGEGATLADEAAEIRPAADSFLFACARGLPEAMLEFQPTSRMLRLVQSGRFDLGQRQEDLVARLVFRAEDEKQARNVADLVRGTLALARLAGGEDVPEEVLDLVDSLRIETRDASVALDFAYPFEQLMGLLRSLSEEG